MVKIFFLELKKLPDDAMIQLKLNALPVRMQQNILSYKNLDDRILRLAGKLLLQEMIRHFNVENFCSLDKIEIDENGKPHFDHQLFFSIAHSENIAVCAASLEGAIGIDVEKIQPLNLDLYEDYFTEPEWTKIKHNKDISSTLYDFWTRKEAVLKVNGNGIKSNFNSIEVITDTVKINNSNYYLQKIKLLQGYSCHLASAISNQEINITELNIFEDKQQMPI